EENRVLDLLQAESRGTPAAGVKEPLATSAIHSRAACRIASRVSRAVSRQENLAARTGPAAASFIRNPSSQARRRMASRIAAVSDGSNCSAASAAIPETG